MPLTSVRQYRWLGDAMRNELDAGFTFFTLRANIPLSARAVDVLKRWNRNGKDCFPPADRKPLQASLLGQQQKRVRELLKLRPDFVIHVHPSPEAVELAFGRLMALNLQKVGTNLRTPEHGAAMEIQ